MNESDTPVSEHELPDALARAKREVSLYCPSCRQGLEEGAECLTCARCAREYPLVDGIPVLRNSDAVYFGEFGRDEMARLLEEASTNLDGALRRQLRESQAPARLGEYIMGAGRAGWKFLLPVGPDARVLDVGCGWGTLAYDLAKSCRSVTAIDSTPQRMQFLNLRAAKEGMEGLQCVCAGDGLYLPFEDRSFDIAILNGVLEWVPCNEQGNPREVQLAFLREIRRVLGKSGVLYMAIENRYAWKTWFRNADGHTGLRFVAWLPRKLADWYSRLRGQGPYRNYLYGKHQYERLLREAGFGQSQFYVPLPGYHHPLEMVPAKQRSRVTRHFVRRGDPMMTRLRRWVKGSLSAHFPDCFGVVAGNGGTENGLLSKLSRHLSEQMPRTCPAGAQPVLYRMNGEMGMVTAVMKDSAATNSNYVLKLPLHDRGKEGLQREARYFATAHVESSPLAPLRELLPHLLCEGTLESQYFAVFDVLSGVTAEHLPGGPRGASQALAGAAEFAMNLHRATEETEENWNELVDSLIGATAKKIRSLAASQVYEQALDRLTGLLTESLLKEEPRPVLGHGDFKLANCLFDPATCRLTGVLDWGAGLLKELPLYDLSFVLADYLAKTLKTTLGQTLRDWLRSSGEECPEYGRIAEWAKELGMRPDSNRLRVLGGYQWLKRMAPLASGHEARRFDYRFVDSMFDVLVEGRL